MEIGIAGLPGAGKTTVLNALARGHAHVGTFTGAEAEPNRAVLKVPDPRVDTLAEMFHPKSVKHAEVQLVDIAGVAPGAGVESAAAVLAHLRTVDALLVVIGAFVDGTTPESVLADLRAVEGELLLADLDVVERRLDRLDREVRMARGNDVERQAKAREIDLLRRLKAALDRELPLRAIPVEREEEKLLRGYALLTAKPALAILNVGDDLEAGRRLLAAAQAHQRTVPVDWETIPARLEGELAELEPEEAGEFMEAMGVEELSAARVIQACYRLLHLVSFMTVNSEEARGWPILRGSTALDAAGIIHSDMARGFIRAEVVTFDDLVACGSLAEARRRGKLRSEGKGYVVQDGDVVHILFNV